MMTVKLRKLGWPDDGSKEKKKNNEDKGNILNQTIYCANFWIKILPFHVFQT